MPRASALRATGLGSAAPPISTFQPERSTWAAAGSLTSMLRMLGTQWEKVTPSLARSLSSTSGM